ncbi:hypothetical protein [Kutzneria sp. CA-103260]|uniref:hypothetical protein n=1 Tax=Kutzneria sp. CA-103260 TaxID=2802641 RepID=UPI001BA82B29|nr:hypothetical protein [Kutzneria sp. CA-103260]QUQ68600.1 hypothetical protein JJ691_63470 [Kutzneria sp. CA-103260]
MNGHLELVRELKRLRKGRGVLAGGIQQRVGPAVRAACDIDAGDGPVAVRRKLTVRLIELAEQLPEDLRLVTLVAFAIERDAKQALYQERVRWAAIQLERDERTVRRRVDEAINQVAELAAGDGNWFGGWRTAELSVAVALDQDRPEVLEQRRIVAEQDDLREVELVAPIPLGQSDVQVLYGGTLIADDPAGFTLALPTPVAKEERHDLAVRFRLPPRQAMQQYLLCVPKRPCERFDLRLRFRRDGRPPTVFALHGTPGENPPRDGREQAVDRAGEVHVRFHQLTPGLAYGARWEWPV